MACVDAWLVCIRCAICLKQFSREGGKAGPGASETAEQLPVAHFRCKHSLHEACAEAWIRACSALGLSLTCPQECGQGLQRVAAL